MEQGARRSGLHPGEVSAGDALTHTIQADPGLLPEVDMLQLKPDITLGSM